MLSILFSLYLSLFGFTNSLPAMEEVRIQFVQSVEDSDKANDLYDKLNNKSVISDPLYLGYFGATEALLAKHHWNPYKKLEYLAKSQKTLQIAISKSPNNLELRFLRFSIQHYLPSFLGQSKNIDEDKTVMLKELAANNYAPEDKPIAINVAKFLIESKRCTAEQTIALKKLVSNI